MFISVHALIKTLILQLWICYTLFYAAIGSAVRKFIVGQSCGSVATVKTAHDGRLLGWEYYWYVNCQHSTLWGIKNTKMCFAITFVKIDGFWTNLVDCFLNKAVQTNVTWTESAYWNIRLCQFCKSSKNKLKFLYKSSTSSASYYLLKLESH